MYLLSQKAEIKPLQLYMLKKKCRFFIFTKNIYISVIGCFNIKIFLSIIFILLMVLFLLFVKIKTHSHYTAHRNMNIIIITDVICSYVNVSVTHLTSA